MILTTILIAGFIMLLFLFFVWAFTDDDEFTDYP